MPLKDLQKLFRVKPGEPANLAKRDPSWHRPKEIKGLSKRDAKAKAGQILTESLDALSAAQQVLYADNRYSVLIVLQAIDAAGKDGTIKHVMSGINPQGCQVFSFKQPSAEELDHNFLWRYSRALPERGRIGIFNRSYYEEVLVVRVHPPILAAQRIPDITPNNHFWQQRFEDINAFERHLTRNGTVILKFFLHLSRGEQKKRFLQRLDNPEKHWKFSAADLRERSYWDDYAKAYEETLTATSTAWAPWYVIPADHKWITRAAVADVLSSTIQNLDLRYPPLSTEQQADLAKARAELEAEPD